MIMNILIAIVCLCLLPVAAALYIEGGPRGQLKNVDHDEHSTIAPDWRAYGNPTPGYTPRHRPRRERSNSNLRD